MTGLATGDKHLDLVSDGMPRLAEQRLILQFCLDELERREPDIYVDLGDLFDKAKPSPPAHAEGIRYATGLADWRSMDPIRRRAYIVRGNHDVTSQGGVCALDPIKELARADPRNFPVVVEEPRVELWGDAYVLAFLPHLTPDMTYPGKTPQETLDEFAQTLLKDTGDRRILAFSHLEVEGATANEWDTRQRETGLFVPKALLESEKLLRLYGGHIHRYQTLEKATIVGSALHVDFGEALDPKGVVYFETEDE